MINITLYRHTWEHGHRRWQETHTIYHLEDGTVFFSPDGESRIFYDSRDEAVSAGVDFDTEVEVDIWS